MSSMAICVQSLWSTQVLERIVGAGFTPMLNSPKEF